MIFLSSSHPGKGFNWFESSRPRIFNQTDLKIWNGIPNHHVHSDQKLRINILITLLIGLRKADPDKQTSDVGIKVSRLLHVIRTLFGPEKIVPQREKAWGLSTGAGSSLNEARAQVSVIKSRYVSGLMPKRSDETAVGLVAPKGQRRLQVGFELVAVRLKPRRGDPC